MRSDFSLNMITIYISPSRTQQHFPPCGSKCSDRFLRGNFGVGGVKNVLRKKTFLTRKLFGKISSPKIPSGNFGSNSPSRGNFEAQNFLETRGNFTWKFLDHLIIELKSVPFPSTVCCTHTCIESHKRCPKSLDERAWQDFCTRWNDD